MRHIASSLAAVLVVSLATSASAEPFNGPFIGVQAGWNQDDLGTPSTELGDLSIGQKRDSFNGGVFAGYDHKIGNSFVVGGEAGLQFGVDDKIVRDTGAGLITADPKRAIDLTARAGYLVNDKTLVYARGGYTNARVRTTVADAAGIRSVSENRDGWLVGGGLERAITDNVTARVEYRYADLSEGDGKFDRHQALVGVAYRF
ncbi:MAG: outer membrane protein [Novosphingobium sp.]